MRFLVALSFAAVLATPAYAQFAINVQQNGQSAIITNGSTITLSAAGIGQGATASVTLTNTGSSNVAFPSSAQILGSSNFSSGASATTLNSLQSTTFVIQYSQATASQTTGQFVWTFNTLSPTGTVTGTGNLTFGLVGTSPNVVVSQVTNGSFQPVANGGNIQFPVTLVNGTSSVTIAVSNTGSASAAINSITTSGTGFSMSSVPILPITINAGNQLNLSAQFTPTSAGPATGSFQITFTNGTTFTATLSGTGIVSALSYNITEDGTTSPLSPGQAITIDNTPVGGSSSAVIQFQNTSGTAVVLSGIAISGAGFSLTNGPFFPLTLQPQQTNSVTIVYTPTQPGPSVGRLQIGSDSFTLSATGLGPLLTYSYQITTTQSVNPGGTITLPAVAEGQTSSVLFTITNTGTAPASVASIGITGPAGVFTLVNSPALPLQLNPATATTFTINFSPLTLGASTSTLLINSQSFVLSGFSTAPPALPAYQFTGASGTQQPFQQPSIGLSLNTPYAIALSGTLTITVISNSFVADPAVQFSSGGLKVAFTIPANTLQAIFPNSATQIRLQTGTVAGAIQITPDFTVVNASGTDITPPNPATLQLTVPSQAPVLLNAALSSQTLTGFSIAVTGFTTTRALQNLTFQLTPATGSTLSTTTISLDLSGLSSIFFATNASQAAGGQFVVTVPFTLTQSGSSATSNLASQIKSVSVAATDSIGGSNAVQIVIP